MNNASVSRALGRRLLVAVCSLLALLCSFLQLAGQAGPAQADDPEPSVRGIVTVSTIDSAGDRVPTEIRLLAVADGSEELASIGTGGFLEVQVPPGGYVASVYMNGGFLAKSDVFDVAPHDHRYVVIEVSAAHISSFAIHPEHQASGQLSQLRVAYSIVNLGTESSSAEVRLIVTKDGEPLETITFPEGVFCGHSSSSRIYRPAKGWEKGTYGFSLQLYLDGHMQAETNELTFSKTGQGGIATWMWVLFLVLGVAVAAGLGLVALLLWEKRSRGRRPAPEREERYEDKPARGLEETEPKADALTAQDVPSRQAVPSEETSAQPAPLSSVSKLKARMASLNRDQGVVQEENAETDTTGKDSA